jgi:hypothetical protein
MLVFVEMEIALGLLVLLAEHAVGRSELGHDQTAAAEVADEAPEDRVGNSAMGARTVAGAMLTPPMQRLAGTGFSGAARRTACPELVEGSPREPFPGVVPELCFTGLFYLGSQNQSPRHGRGLNLLYQSVIRGKV